MRASNRPVSRSNVVVVMPTQAAPSLPSIPEAMPVLSLVPPPVRESSEDQALAGSLTMDEQIAAEAYSLYLARGGEDGHDVEDWLTAEECVRERRR